VGSRKSARLVLLLPTNKIEHLIYFVNPATVLTYRLSAISLESGVVSRKSEVRRPVGQTASRHEDVVTTALLPPVIFDIFDIFDAFTPTWVSSPLSSLSSLLPYAAIPLATPVSCHSPASRSLRNLRILRNLP
jgi:hypothetical protein